MNKIYTAGYSGHTLAQLKQAVAELGAVVVDIRMSPRSRMPEWNGDEMARVLGESYRHLPEWGSVNFKGRRVVLQDPRKGFFQVQEWAKSQPLILLCGCADFKKCHRGVCSYLLNDNGLEAEELSWPASPVGAGKIPCLSLWQPWASLIALGEKKIETRSWSTSYRGPIAIHAAKTKRGFEDISWKDPDGIIEIDEPFASAFERHGILSLSDLPLGAVLCVADLMLCEPTEDILPHISEQEYQFGNYERGRFGWMLQDVRALPEPVPMRGQQGLWSVDLSEVQP